MAVCNSIERIVTAEGAHVRGRLQGGLLLCMVATWRAERLIQDQQSLRRMTSSTGSEAQVCTECKYGLKG